MAEETKSPEQILEEQIREARTATLNKLYKPTDDPTEGRKDTREDKRLMRKYLNELDGLVQRFMEFRSTLDDPEGEEADNKFVYYNTIWLATCSKFNKKRKHGFSLRDDAFTDRVDGLLEVEKEQIKAAKAEHDSKLFEQWYRRNLINYKWRERWYKLKGKLTKKTSKELFRAYWDRLEILAHKPPTFEV